MVSYRVTPELYDQLWYNARLCAATMESAGGLMGPFIGRIRYVCLQEVQR